MFNKFLFAALLIIAFVLIGTAQTTGLKDYYNKENKVGFKYPAKKWKMEKEESQYVSGEESGFNLLADIRREDNALPENISEAEVSLKTAALDEPTCTAMKIDNLNPYKTIAKKIGTRKFYYVETDDGSAGHISVTQFYRTFNDGRCYELAFTTFGENTRKRAQSNKIMDQQFNSILRSLYFK